MHMHTIARHAHGRKDCGTPTDHGDAARVCDGSACGNLKAVEFLHTQRPADTFGAVDNNGCYAIHYACGAVPTDLIAEQPTPGRQQTSPDDNQLHVVEFLVNKYEESGNTLDTLLKDTQDNERKTSLHHACLAGSLKLVDFLVNRCPRLKAFLPVQNDHTIKSMVEEKIETLRAHNRKKKAEAAERSERETKRLREVLHWLEKSVAVSIAVGHYIEPLSTGSDHVRLLTNHLALGSLFVGMPGAGKTVGMKKMVEEVALLNSMRHVIILDVKGDWSQIIQKNDKRTDDFFKERGVDVRIFTFGTDHGWRATLDPFVSFGGGKALKDMSRDEKCDLHGRLRLFVKDGAHFDASHTSHRPQLL
jgi:hypothetical protein